MTATTKKLPPELDPLSSLPGVAGSVLLSDQIEYYCANLDPPLIGNFSKKNLKPARYNLRLGDEAHIEGKWVKIDDKQPLILQPHQVAVVRTFEQINLPRFLIGRWNLRVDMVYEGLLWVGALQVDPGWQGCLPCPIYNLANRPIEIRYKQKVFSIDFVRTTPYTKEKQENYPYTSIPYTVSDDIGIAEHDKNRLQSAVSATVEKVESLRTTVFTFMMAGLTGFSILFAALGIFFTASIRKESDVGSTLLSTVVPVSYIAFVAGIIAVVLSSYAATRERIPLSFRSRWPQVVVGLLGLATLAWGLYTLVAVRVGLIAEMTPQWVLNLPIFYSGLHVIASAVLFWIYWLIDRKTRF